VHPELFRIPFTDLTVKSYGLLMVCGFVAAIFIIRRLSRSMGQKNTEHITTAALYSLIAGVVGARLFYVVHYWQQFRGGRLIDIFAVWNGGLELLGGVFLAIFIIVLYLRTQKLPIRRYLDILAIGLMLALVFGRLGCLLNGCCFGKPADSVISIRFPYGSLAYQSQVRPDFARHREKPYIELPDDFFNIDNNYYYLKPYDLLNSQEKFEVTQGPYRCRPVWPTQIFESISALIGCILLYIHRKRGIRLQSIGETIPIFFRPGVTFALMFVIYGIMRFFIEFLRDDNPFQANGLTISQNLSIAMVLGGFLLIWLFGKAKPDKII